MCCSYIFWVYCSYIFWVCCSYIFWCSECVDAYTECVYVERVSIFAGCIYAKCLCVYIPVCSCINWVTSVKLCVCACVCVRVCVCQVNSYMCWCVGVHAGCVGIYVGCVGLSAGWVDATARCLGAHAMRLRYCLVWRYIWMSVLQKRIRIYWDTHTNAYKLQHDFAVLHWLCILKVSTNDVSVVEVIAVIVVRS